ncbi:TadE family type IV pilus minor pilin [Nakamurella sp. PAMC28650]|uniref:TadE family type IV pilus minor pilin n=1 Tax=Nakamurella sp. PAMC28650 TaxID=2762325 RepID=UPI0021048B08|nr:TadE family type IV pilus minor pilin [Nakamurella sp. PAMC28650]
MTTIRSRHGHGTRLGRVGDRGSVTVEAALVLAVLTVVVAACLAGIGCVIAQMRCVDAAREAARLSGRGDSAAAAAAVAQIAPQGAVLTVQFDGDMVTATVHVGAVSGLLPGVSVGATATAVKEQGVTDG